MTTDDMSKTDLMYEITYNPKFVLSRASRVNVKTNTIEGTNRYFLKKHETGELYELSELGNDIWNLIDGHRTIGEINRSIAESYEDFQPEMLKEALLFFAEEGALKAVSEPVKKKRFSIVSAFQIRVCLLWQSKHFISSIHRVLRPLLRRSLLWPILVFVTIMGILFAGSFVTIFSTKENFEIMGSTIVGFFFYYLIVLSPVIVIHELAHGLALVHYGGEPMEMGTGLYFFGPMFYIDVTDGWSVGRYQRIMIYAAGPISEILFGSVIMVVQYLWTFSPAVSHILTMAVFYCFYGLLVDISPLLEADGYYILCDALKIPDLREKSVEYLKAVGRRLLRRKVESEGEALTIKSKLIFVTYAVIVAVWVVYLVVRSLMVFTYMAQDTATAVLNVSSAILLNNPLTITAVVIAVASVLYFGMVSSGYGLMIFAALKKVAKKTLRLEVIHDRDFSVFLYLPINVSQSLLTDLKQRTARAAKNLTRNYSVRQSGSTCVAVLRMSSARLALVQLREHFQKMEKGFGSIYQNFLSRHKDDILESVGVYGSQGTKLPDLLLDMAKQAEKAGTPEAKSIASQVIDRQAKNAFYLLNSAYGSVWTVEVPPALMHEIGESFLPSITAEDMVITDLYEETEEFKKRLVYGFDSLAKLASENQEGLREVILHPEKYQVVSFFEPIKSRLIFVGRTEQIEQVLDSVCSLFICQAWAGYLDNLVSEVNFSLLAFDRFPLPDAESTRLMKDGELAALEKTLSTLLAQEESIAESLRNSQKKLKQAKLESTKLRKLLSPTGDFKVGLLDPTLQINAENLEHLSSQFESFETLYEELFKHVREIRKTVKEELNKRKPGIVRKIHKRLVVAPLFVALSVILALAGLWMFTDYMRIAFLAGALLLQCFYWTAYLLSSRSFKTVGRYPTPAFRQIHFFTFAFTEALYKFMTAVNILNPTDTDSAGSKSSLPKE